MFNCFKAVYSDDYREGPSLSIIEIDDFESDEPSANHDESYDLEIPFTLEYQVYFLALGVGEIVMNALGSTFQNLADAELFAKKQYYLRTGDFPFVATGITNAYHSKGKREAISISDDTDKSLIDFKHDDIFREFLIISNGNFVESHSLNPFAKW